MNRSERNHRGLLEVRDGFISWFMGSQDSFVAAHGSHEPDVKFVAEFINSAINFRLSRFMGSRSALAGVARSFVGGRGGDTTSRGLKVSQISLCRRARG
jgi:hypothetical protein